MTSLGAPSASADHARSSRWTTCVVPGLSPPGWEDVDRTPGLKGERVPKLKGDLGPLERAIMHEIWSHPDAHITVREVLDSPAGKGLAYTTVMTVLDRLWRKGYLARRRSGRAYLYSAKRTREEHVESLVTEVLAGADDRKSALLSFVRSVDDDEIESLRKAIRQVQRERRIDR